MQRWPHLLIVQCCSVARPSTVLVSTPYQHATARRARRQRVAPNHHALTISAMDAALASIVQLEVGVLGVWCMCRTHTGGCACEAARA
jgi:hypothetical protein